MKNVILYANAQLHRFKTLNAYRGKDWRKIKIIECGEPLVLVRDEYSHSFYCKNMKLTSDSRIFLRKGLYERFLKANQIADTFGYNIVVYDGWRPVALQEELFWHYMKHFTVSKFNLSSSFDALNSSEEIKNVFFSLDPSLQVTLREANRTYVSLPSSDPNAPSPHFTGGSIDVWLYEKGEALNLGVPFDWMEDDAGCFFHLKKQNSIRNSRIKRNRNILIYCMTRAGFSCYGPEIWHYNFGNQMDSLVKNTHAIYGPISI